LSGRTSLWCSEVDGNCENVIGRVRVRNRHLNQVRTFIGGLANRGGRSSMRGSNS
jgi:hypothetical protein